MILLLSQVSWVGRLETNLDYVAQTGPLAIIIEVFPTNRSDGTCSFKFHCKRIPPNAEGTGRPWLIFLPCKHGIFCYKCKLLSSGHTLAQHSIPLLSAGTTLVPLFWSGKCLAREEVLISVVIFELLGLGRCPLKSLLVRFWRHPSGLAFSKSPISIIMS